jgi:hypothetical protein
MRAGWELAGILPAGPGQGGDRALALPLLLRPRATNKIFIFDEQTAVCYRIGISQLERIMPKGTIRNPGSKKPLLSVKTFAGKQLPLRSKAELNARSKNMNREISYASTRERNIPRDIRADKSVMTKAKKTIRPAASAKKGTK